jgi:hypothetical protein
MSGVFNIVNSLRGEDHVGSDLMQARAQLFRLFEVRMGRIPHGNESDRLDIALDGLMKKNTGFEHAVGEMSVWHNMHYPIDSNQQMGTMGYVNQQPSFVDSNTIAEYGIDEMIASQMHTNDITRDNGATFIGRWVERAYRLAMGNVDRTDVLWMQGRYLKEERPRRNNMDISSISTMPMRGNPIGVSHRAHLETRPMDGMRGVTNPHFDEINPLQSIPNPLDQSPYNLS